MTRVSTNMPMTNAQFSIRHQEQNMYNIQNQITGNKRLNRLSDDPIAASHAVRYDSYLTRLNRFERNIGYAQDHLNNTHDFLYSTNSILQRIRELSVQAANGTYAPDDLKNMAVEVNELLKEIVSISNVLGPDTKQAFAGDKVFTQPFRIVEGRVEGGQETMITGVEYRGAGTSRNVEISDNNFLELDIGGDEAFWAERMQIFSSVDATDYRVTENGAFFIDGVEIAVNIGDTLPAIVAKINDSGAPVKAYIDINTRGLVLEGASAHLIRAEDKTGGAAVLRDLGIINGNMINNAPNWATSARVAGGSVFDMVIRLRDAMLRGDQDFIGSQGKVGIDLALNNIVYRLADVSSRKQRADAAWYRVNQQIPNIAAMYEREAGLDLATAATDLKKAELAHQAILSTTARLLPQSLLNFLR